MGSESSDTAQSHKVYFQFASSIVEYFFKPSWNPKSLPMIKSLRKNFHWWLAVGLERETLAPQSKTSNHAKTLINVLGVLLLRFCPIYHGTPVFVARSLGHLDPDYNHNIKVYFCRWNSTVFFYTLHMFHRILIIAYVTKSANLDKCC